MKTMRTILMAVALATAATPAMAAELVSNGNFSAGNTGFSSDYPYKAGAPSSGQGQPTYSIGTDAATTANAYGDWGGFGDHTTGTGNMLVADGLAGRAWFTTVSLVANTVYDWSFWGHTVQGNSGGPAVLSFRIGGVDQGSPLTLPLNSNSSWQRLGGSYTAAMSGDVEIAIYDSNNNTAYNDFALDDISFASRDVTSPVPEPATWAMMLLGFATIGVIERRRPATATAIA